MARTLLLSRPIQAAATEGSRDLAKTAAVLMLLMVGLVPAQALDLRDLAPCKAVAIRLCDRSQGLTTAALWKCGATLASRSAEVSRKCLAVLVRYGQLSADSLSGEKAPVP
jgi:hypothetical protein